MENELLFLSFAAVTLIRLQKKRRKPRKLWIKKWLLKRNQYSHVNILKELRFHPKDWHNYMRMTEPTYLKLLKLVSPKIQKHDTNMRQAVSNHERLSATLRFLATGRSYEDLKFSSIISPQLLGKIIPETCAAIYEACHDYCKLPSNESEWKAIGTDFEKRWNFPNCLGAVDGKHIKIKPPPESGSYFFNYKHFHSQVLMAIANANYELIYFHFGTNGRVSDGGVIKNTDFYQKLINGTLGLPQPDSVNGITLPYVFVGDEAFALRSNFLKPFNKSQLNENRRIFNYRLSRARRIIENVFGILVARFGILKIGINLDLDSIAPVVMACCALHNFLRRENPDTYSPQDSFDRENYEVGEIEEGLQSNLIGLERRRGSSFQSATESPGQNNVEPVPTGSVSTSQRRFSPPAYPETEEFILASPVRALTPSGYVAQEQPARNGHTPPQRNQRGRSRRSPRRLIRPGHTELAAQRFLQSDEEWRKFKMEQHRDYMAMRREQNRIRNLELEAQREWRAVGSRALDILEKIVDKFCRD